jgi:predicted  nucleic acid-binding Zn-ribbon protein
MTKSADNIRKSSTLKTHITKTEKEIKQLEKRKDKLNSKIQDIQDSILDLSDDEAQKELGALTSTREVTAGAIQDRHQRIESLNVELAKAKEIEQAEDAFNDIVELTKKAHELVEQRNNIHRWANEVLEKKMLEYADNWSQWIATVKQYTELIPKLEPSFSKGFDIPVEDREVRKEKREKVIKEIENAGLSTRPLRNDLTGRFLGNTRGMLTAMVALEDSNFNLSTLTEGPQRRRKRKLEAKQEQAKRDKEAAE